MQRKHNVMNSISGRLLLVAFLQLATSIEGISQSANPIVVNADKPGSMIQPTMWGIFFEDINFAADGGIYAELIKNRSFEFYKPKTGWKINARDKDSSRFIILNRGTGDNNTRFARLTLDTSEFSITNYGFRGIGCKKDSIYHFSILASVAETDPVKIIAELLNREGGIIGQAELTLSGSGWKKYEADIRAELTEAQARLRIRFKGNGTIDIDMVSLFPSDTWKHRPGGLRADLVKLLADLKPGFIRFPGGCIVEGYDLNQRYQWKKTIGNVDDRKVMINRWNSEFAHRPAPDYFQSFGLGFFEYFQLAEDLGAEPLPILNCGMACQFNSAEVAALDQLEPYIRDALDLIEFANGDAGSEWGNVRSKMGHPEPFNLKYLGIGNEQWGPQYFERYARFEKAIKEKYPEMILISSTGPHPDGGLFDFAVKELNDTQAGIVDEHYYRPPSWFRENAKRYDNYNRNGYKIFAGEYAAQSIHTGSPLNMNNWECAISEAAFMTGLERNADVVVMCSYAPLFAHIDGWQWTPDLIWFSNLESYGTPNYYVQKMFSTNRGTSVLSLLSDGRPLTGEDGLYGSAVFDAESNEIIVKLVNTSEAQKSRDVIVHTKKSLQTRAESISLQSDDLTRVNSIENPRAIYPKTQDISIKGRSLKISLEPYSFTVIRVAIK